MSEDMNGGQLDINELLDKYLSDPEDGSHEAPDTASAGNDKHPQRRRMAARRTPEQEAAEEPSANETSSPDSVKNVYENIEDFEPGGIATDAPGEFPTVMYGAGAQLAGGNSTAEAYEEDAEQTDADDFAGTENSEDAAENVGEAVGGDGENNDQPHKDSADEEKTEIDTGDTGEGGDNAPDAKIFERYEGEDADNYEGIVTEPKSGNSDENDSSGDAGTNEDDIDDFDMNILLGLGMEEELENTVGTERVSKFVAKQQTELNKTVSVNRERAELDYEYTTKTQTREVAEMYRSSYRTSKIKLAVSVIITFVLLLFECHKSFGITLSGPFDPMSYPVVFVMVGLQLTLIIAAFAWKSVWTGLRNFFRGRPMPESVAGFALLFDILYSAAISFCADFGETGPETFNLPVAIGFVLLYIYEWINLRREIMSFGIISSKKKKFALASLSMSDSHLEHEAFSDLMDEDDKAEDISVLKVEGADFVGDYFLRTNRYAGGRKFIGFIIPAVIVFSAAFFAYSYSGAGNMYTGLHAAASVALTCLPVSVFYMFSDPFYRAVKKAQEDDCTIVGEGSVEEYADAAIISFDDKNVFPSTGVNVRGINVFGNNMIDRVLYTAASVFCTVGGPLSDVFDLATRDIGHSDDVEVENCLPGLLEVTVDGQNVMFGSIDALEEAGVRIPKPLEEHRNDDFGDNISVMYMVENGRFVSRMLIQYLVDADFEYTLKQLDKGGMFIGIKTFDPNVTEEFLGRQVKLKKYPVRVIRCKSLDDRTVIADTSVSGLISKDSPKTLLQTVTLCEKVMHARSINTMLVVISLFVSLIIAALSVLFDAIGLSPLFITLYQLFWIVPMFISSMMIVS